MGVPILSSAAEQTNIEQATSLYLSHSVWSRIAKKGLEHFVITQSVIIASYKLQQSLFICDYDCFIIISSIGVQTLSLHKTILNSPRIPCIDMMKTT